MPKFNENYKKEVKNQLNRIVRGLPLMSSDANMVIYSIIYLYYVAVEICKDKHLIVADAPFKKIKYVIEVFEKVRKNNSISKEYKELYDECLFFLENYTDVEIDVFNLQNFLSVEDVTRYAAECMVSDFCDEDKYGACHETPKSINELAIKILKDGHKILDLCSGYGNFTVSYNNHEACFTGYEINPTCSLVSKIRNKIVGNDYSLIKGDVLRDSQFLNSNEKYDRIFVDAPFGYPITKDVSEKISELFSYEVRVSSKSSWAFVLTALPHLSEEGKLVTIIPAGGLFNTLDKDIRRYLIENDLLEAVVRLPRNVVTSTGIELYMIVISNNNKGVKIVDASEMYIEESKYVKSLKAEEAFEKYLKTKDLKTKKQLEKIDYIITADGLINASLEYNNPMTVEELSLDVFRGYQMPLNDFKGEGSGEIKAKFINLSDIDNGVVNPDTRVMKIPADKYEKFALKDKDLIISSKYSSFKSAVMELKGNEKAVASGNFLVIRADQNKVDPYYLKAFIDSELGQKEIACIKTGSVIASINRLALLGYQVSMYDEKFRKNLVHKYMTNKDEIEYHKLALQKALEEQNNLFN